MLAILLLSLAASFVASAPGQDTRIAVAFRTVHPPEARQWQQNGGFLQYNTESGVQLGPGSYFSPVLGEWPPGNGDWYCALTVEPSVWNLVNKAFVPPSYVPANDEGTDSCAVPLFWGRGAVFRPTYLTDVGGSGFTTSNTVLISEIDGDTETPPRTQFLFPPALLSSSNPLNNKAVCVAASDDTAKTILSNLYGTINWRSWQNLRGLSYA